MKWPCLDLVHNQNPSLLPGDKIFLLTMPQLLVTSAQAVGNMCFSKGSQKKEFLETGKNSFVH
jgi:hypothetical protein